MSEGNAMNTKQSTTAQLLTFPPRLDIIEAGGMGDTRNIRAKGRCPVCGGPFSAREGLTCPKHRTRPERYMLDMMHDGTRIRRETDLDGRPIETLAQARALATRARDEAERGSLDVELWSSRGPREHSLAWQLGRWLDEKDALMARGMLAPGYVPKLRTYADNYLLPALGSMDVRHVRASHVKALANDMPSMSPRGRALSPKYVKNVLDALRGFMRWLRDEERLIDDIPRFPQMDVPEHDFQVITPEQQLGILDMVPRKHRRIFQFLFHQGCRPSEARALKWDCVEGEVVTYRRTFSGRRLVQRTKTGRIRRNYLFPEAQYAIKRRLPEDRAEWAAFRDGFVFTHGKSGRPYSANLLNRVYRDARAAYNEAMAARDPRWWPITATLYEATKHSFGTAQYMAGTPLETLQRHFGHSKPEMTLRYARVDAVDEIARLDRERREAMMKAKEGGGAA